MASVRQPHHATHHTQARSELARRHTQPSCQAVDGYHSGTAKEHRQRRLVLAQARPLGLEEVLMSPTVELGVRYPQVAEQQGMAPP